MEEEGLLLEKHVTKTTTQWQNVRRWAPNTRRRLLAVVPIVVGLWLILRLFQSPEDTAMNKPYTPEARPDMQSSNEESKITSSHKVNPQSQTDQVPEGGGIDFTRHVNPFMGTEGEGNMFPGATRPYGAVRMGPDLYTGSNAYSGYLETGNITGFSMMHTSGTGGSPKYGVVTQLPLLGYIEDTLGNVSQTRRRPDEAIVGYYKTHLSSKLIVEMAASDHAGIFRYTNEDRANLTVLVDLAHVLPSFRKKGLSQEYKAGNITISPDNHYEGSAVYANGWNRSPSWEVFFCGRFTTSPRSSGIECQSIGMQGKQHCGSTARVSGTRRIVAAFGFGPERVVESRVGVSWISAARACEYVDNEIPLSTSLEDVAETTRQVWNNQILSKITVEGATPEDKDLLYSSMYGMNIMPTLRTGENPKWDSGEPYFDDIISLWDTHRCTTALMQLLVPETYSGFIRSLIDIWRYDGYMPDARSSNHNGRTQVGSSADVVLADAYVKGVRGEVNWEDGYAAMVANAEIPPFNNSDPLAAPDNSSTQEGRGALPDWIAKGFISHGYSRSVSRAAEYSYNDFGLYQVATALDPGNASKYLDRSRNWRRHWNPQARALNFTGFMVPLDANGSFVEQDPLDCGHCYWENDYYQALPYAYSFAPALHDARTLVEYSRGPEKFIARLEAMFVANVTEPRQGSKQRSVFDAGNEPSFAVPYLFNYVGRQDLSVKYSRMVARQYGTSATGLPGNSDGGALQSWLLWNMIGLYPVTGTTTFLIGSPWFERLVIKLGDGRTFEVLRNEASGKRVPPSRFTQRRVVGERLDSNGTQSKGDYVQSLKVNGKAWTKSWITWDEVFAEGGQMEFVCGPEPLKWATGPLPPSPASEKG